MLEISELEVAYGESTVLRDVNLTVDEGQTVAVLGRNGVGKTTLIETVMGINHPSSGEVLFKGETIAGKSPYQIADMGVGYIPQTKDIFGDISVENNIRLGSASSKSVRLRDEVPPRIYEYFPALEEKANQKGDLLSGGQQQQLAIARALVDSPDLLLLDEPSEGIQPSIVQSTSNVLQQLQDTEDMSFLIVEQNLEFVLNVSDYCYILDNGTVVEHGDPLALSEDGSIEHHLTI